MNQHPNFCPVHPQESMRMEYYSDPDEGWGVQGQILTWYCPACLQRHAACTLTKNLATPMCRLFRGHDGDHVNVRGDRWPQ